MGLGTLIKWILIILGLCFIVRSIMRNIVFWFLGDANKKMDEQLRRQQDEIVRQKKKQEGRVTINYQPKSNKNFEKYEGDYVDFEEYN